MSFFLIALKVIAASSAGIAAFAFSKILWLRARHSSLTKGAARPWERAVARFQPLELPAPVLLQARKLQDLGLKAALLGFFSWALTYLIERAARN